MSDVGRPVVEKLTNQPAFAVLVPDEGYLLREYVNELQNMDMAKELDFGGQMEGELFTFVPQLELVEKR